MNLEEFEIGRRLVHSSGIAFPITYFLTDEWLYVQLLLLLALIVVSVLEYLRLKKGYTNILFDRLTRSYESEKIAGYYLYIVGMFLVAVFLHPLIAVSSMIILAIGDPVGGILSDAEPSGTKSIKAVLSLLTVSTVIAFSVTSITFPTSESAIIALTGGCVGALSDYKKLIINDYIVDDNLVIPVATGFVMQFVYHLVPFISSINLF